MVTVSEGWNGNSHPAVSPYCLCAEVLLSAALEEYIMVKKESRFLIWFLKVYTHIHICVSIQEGNKLNSDCLAKERELGIGN